MPRPVLDFDAWLAEDHPIEPIPFKLLGKVWEIPGELPAIVQLKLEKIRFLIATYDPDNPALPDGLDMADLTYESLARDMLGDAMVDEWLALGIGEKTMPRVTQRLMQIYVTGGDGLGKPAPPGAAKKRKRKKKRTGPPKPPQAERSSPQS